ncbi:hypothetical protein ACJ72_07469 [Emergomyces africanus]|uniref:Cytochrome P450 n=1 Tax=Emergomyces africanus TaxID=1955775 RepID=A0A1B7NNL4_9EURO|nr:hypothetical protein ACJ72_07469 [Emergomyces africanus]
MATTVILATLQEYLSNPLPISTSSIITSTFLLTAVLIIIKFFYTEDPLHHVPGPLIARLTPLWLWNLTWRGIECRTITALHKRYGRVVRIAPNEVDISDGAALQPIYVKNGGFVKSPVYAHYDIDGFQTIFSGMDPVHRAVRAKAVAPVFAQQAVIRGREVVLRVVDAAVTELERWKEAAAAASAASDPTPPAVVDILNLFRSLAIDAVSVYLFGESFNSLNNSNNHNNNNNDTDNNNTNNNNNNNNTRSRLTATPFVDNFAAGGRFFYLPGWIFNHVDHWAAKFDKNKERIATSTAIVKEFATRVVDRSIAEEKEKGKNDPQTYAYTYQSRLLHAGISRDETIAQVLDVMFAGTDGVAMTISVLCWHLSQHPDKYKRLHKEILNNPDTDAQSLPYLSAVVKESLRLSMANPTRLPRIVPPGGLHVPGLPTAIPAGTSVGLGAYVLHHDPDVYPQPYEFMPERWLDCTPEMLRNSIPFGMGSRQCIARNFASAVVWWTAEALVRADVLQGLKPVVGVDIEIMEWFNAKVIAGKIELHW